MFTAYTVIVVFMLLSDPTLPDMIYEQEFFYIEYE